MKPLRLLQRNLIGSNLLQPRILKATVLEVYFSLKAQLTEVCFSPGSNYSKLEILEVVVFETGRRVVCFVYFLADNRRISQFTCSEKCKLPTEKLA